MEETSNGRLILWKLGSNPDIGYCAGSQEFANDVLALMKEANQLRAELAKEREKVKELEVKRDVAVATIEALKVKCDVRGRALAGQAAETKQLREQLEQLEQQAETRKLALDAAVSSSCVLAADLAAAQATIEQMREAQCNQDALHEARALECERLADMEGVEAGHREWLREEAAAHRAKKGEGK